METSIFLAKVMGLYLIIACLAVLLNRKPFSKVMKAYVENVPAIFFHGLIALMLGLLVVVSHNVWVSDWRVIITVIGWLMLLKGIIRLFMFEKIIKLAWKVYNAVSPVVFIICLLAGVYLAYKGFIA